ncbi:MAG TPA: hypothetical protein VHJ20_01515 [Polyangia bacterium]|nr:hypothetical protein [Polyangia bacterium]
MADPDVPTDSTAGAAPATSAVERGVFDLLKDAADLYRKHTRALILTCAVVFLPASILKSCAYAVVTAPTLAAASAAGEAIAPPNTDELQKVQADLQDAYARNADKATIERLQANQQRLLVEMGRKSMAAASAAMSGFTSLILGLLGTLITTFFVYGIVVPLTNGALTIFVADRQAGGTVGWREAWGLLLRRLIPLIATVVPAACLIAFGFLFFVLPGFVLGLLFAFLAPAVLLENKRGRLAMQRSLELVGGDWLRVALMVVALGVLNWLAQIVVGIFVPHRALFLGGVLSDLLTLFFLPLPVTAMVLLYLDVRRKKDGVTDDAAWVARLRAELDALKAA